MKRVDTALYQFLVENPRPEEESLRELALIRWEEDVLRERRRREQEERDRQERARRRAEHRAREAANKREKRLREEQNYLLQRGIDQVFDDLWDIYSPLIGLKQKEIYQRTEKLPKGVQWVLMKLNKGKRWNWHDKSYATLKRNFMDFALEKNPKRVAEIFFPDGEPIDLTQYRTIPHRGLGRIRDKERQLERDGYIPI